MRRPTVTRGSELPDIPPGATPMVYKTLEAQSDVAGRGTDGRSPRETLEQRLAGTPQEVRTLAAPK
ncbi:hypothetical protein XAC3218_1120020 [Xanthomonas citri pv. citri]|nr:hypothetical protein XAC3218_1120020 [Xanthomonas citri pv. citri]CEH83459.1 hypothetical protein XACB302_10730003 [Xanthomonas citri pv. citri]